MFIGITAVMLGAGTVSYFTDTEISTGNTFTAGTIDIEFSQDDWFVRIPGDESMLPDLKPCQTGYIEVGIYNNGTNLCEVWEHINNTVNDENNVMEPEQNYYADYPESVNWHISDWIHYDIEIDGMVILNETEGYYLTDHGTNPDNDDMGVECYWIYLGVIQPGNTMIVKQSYHLDEDVENWGQSDKVLFDMEFFAQQTEGIPQAPAPQPELPGHGRITEEVIADIYVDDNFDENTPGWQVTHFDKIQDGIDAVSSSTVFVFSGIYYENVVVDKTINLIGEDKETTVIDGSGGDVVYVYNDSIMITEFTIQNGVDGINFHSSFNTVINNVIVSNINGIVIANQRHDNIIENNFIDSNSGYGIHTDFSDNNIIRNNIISNNGLYGIYLYFSSDDNIIYHNNLINNTGNAYDVGSNTDWDNGYPSGGNYWSDFDEPSEGAWDNNSDGIVDSSYLTHGSINQDLYPLVHPYGSITNIDTGEVFLTIQGAIDDSDTLSGHTIFVKSGTYYENIIINKEGISLIGENKYLTIVDGSNDYGNGIQIFNCDYVNISNFTIRNTQVDYGYIFPDMTGNGISIQAYVYISGSETANHNNVTNCIIYNNSRDGIQIQANEKGQSAHYNIISNCEIYGNGADPLVDEGHGVSILPDRDGVTGWSWTNNNQINNCSIYNNTIGVRIGREGESSNNIVSRCQIFDNSKYGLFLYGQDGGGAVALTTDNYIYENSIYGNYLYGICIKTRDGANCGNNYIYHNNLLNATNNAYDEHNNYWDNGYPSGGNYWSDYSGIDLYNGPNQNISGSDGIGDAPYNISGGSNQDNYPFMNQNGWLMPSTPSIVYVDDDYNDSTPGWGYDHFDNIQDGIDAVAESGTVFVSNGTYYESIDILKPINLTGEDKNSTIIDGGGSGDIVELRADYVKIKGFTIQNSGGSGIDTYSNQCSISDNILQNNGRGIYTYLGGHQNTIQDNIILCNDIGIYLKKTYSTIVSGNIFLKNRWASHFYDYNYNNVVSGNIFNLNYEGCIYFWLGENNTISNNNIKDNDAVGIVLVNSVNNIAIENLVENNKYGVRLIESSNNNLIYHNNIINNSLQAEDTGSNTWDDGYPSGGNYWSEYTGEDNYHGPDQDLPGPDGIGDTSYPISGGSNQDNYPLMNPWDGVISTFYLYSTDDSGLWYGNDDAHGDWEYMVIRNAYGAGGSAVYECDGLIKFDLSLIPPDVTIVSATLNLYYYYYDDSPPVGRNLSAYRVTSDWNENTITWSNQPSYASQPTTSATVPGSYSWMSWDVTSDVQSYVDLINPNYGWKLTDENYWGGANIPQTYLRTKEYGDFIPYLEIEIIL